MKYSFILFSLLFCVGRPVWAMQNTLCMVKLMLSPQLTIDPQVQAQMMSAKWDEAILQQMLRGGSPMFAPSHDPSGIVGSIYARSPVDGVVYRVYFLYEENYEIFRIIACSSG